MTQKTTQKDETFSSEEELTDFETLLLRRNAKEKLETDEWSELLIEDVQIYAGYEFTDATLANDKDTTAIPIRGTITCEESPKEVLQELDETGADVEYTLKQTRFRKADGSFMLGGREVLYRRRNWVVVTISSPDQSYCEKFVITRTPKFGKVTLEDVFTSLDAQKGRMGVIGSPPDTNKRFIRLDKTSESKRSAMLLSTILRMGSISGAFFGSFIGATVALAATSSLLIGTFVMIGMLFASIAVQKWFYDDWFELAQPDWLDDLPESAEVTQQIAEEEFETQTGTIQSRTMGNDGMEFIFDEAEVTSFENGTVLVRSDTATWTFENEEEGIPSTDAIQFYKAYGIDFHEMDRIPIRIAPYDDQLSLEPGQYRSDCGDWVLEADDLI